MLKNIFESLETNAGYMLMNDGEYFKVVIHPQLLGFDEIKSDNLDEYDLNRALFWVTENRETDLHWYYDHTNSETVKNHILNFVSLGAQILKKDVPEFDIKYIDTSDTYDFNYVKTLLYLIQLSLNQEFCKVRVSGKYQQVSAPKSSIYFRISSINFDWYQIIWEFINKNKSYIDDITIITDIDAKGNEKLYSYKNNPIQNMNVNEFISLDHSIIIESLNCKTIILQKLSEGQSLIDSCGNVNPYRVFMNAICAYERFNMCDLKLFI